MRFAVILLVVCIAFGQQTKVFQFTQNQSPSDLEEVAAVVRGIVGINAARTLTANASGEKIGLASWLVHQLDVPADAVHGVPGEWTSGPDDIVFPYMTIAPTSDALQKIATAVRTMADIQRVFVCESLKTVVLRTGTSQQFSVATWLIGQLNWPKDVPTPRPLDLELSDGETLRIFELTHVPAPPDGALIELYNLVRTVADVPRVFPYSERNILMIRERADKMALAAWLVNELDRPASAQAVTGESLVAREYPISLQEKKVRLFYLPPPPQFWNDVQKGNYALKASDLVRMNSGADRASGYALLNAVAVRGTPDELATAQSLLEDFVNRPPE